MARETCPICKRLLLVRADGPPDSDILIIGEYPGVEEIREGRPWIGQAGKVLDYELERAGLPRDRCRVTNLWLHSPPPRPKSTRPKTKPAIAKWQDTINSFEPEFIWHFKQMLKEMDGKRAILLMGSDVTEALLGVTVTEVAGCFVKSRNFPKSVKIAVAMMNPAVVFRTGPEGKLGETRLAIQRFAEAVNGFN